MKCLCLQVEADRGEDIGRIVQRATDVSKIGLGKESGNPGEESTGRNKRHDLPTKKIICVASQREFEMLNEQVSRSHFGLLWLKVTLTDCDCTA